ncbi:MAG: CHAD domain-containing protein [Candidatus Eremiobacteraeota bacterium]|nr:CHAD domain-containing protein [Candidatus Eremiobacteraeota bacterium]MBV9647849.1 CHAD domain-containing protein [Candidatus Eremiobacteraeota bacterium]
MMVDTVGASARPAIRSAQRRFFACAGHAVVRADTAELHRARIAAKRLRYTVEFFCSVLREPANTALGLLTLMQDRLGSVADEAALRRFYAGLAKGLPRDDPRLPGLRSLIADCDARRVLALEAVQTLWNGGEFPPYADMLGAALSGALSGL